MAADLGNFRIRKLDSIGAAAAEEDEQFLAECFVDNGYLDHLRDCANPRRVIVGRTGTGKTALLKRLAENYRKQTIIVRPETLALEHVSNSDILRFVADLGVKLDIFFKLLWRHVLVVEILRQRFNITSEKAKATFFQRIASTFSSPNKKALNYLEEWGPKFWLEREHRVKEVTKTLEQDLGGAVSAAVPLVKFDLESKHKLSKEEREEIVHRSQKVVNQVQMKQLGWIIDMINDVLSDPQKPCYVTIDGLDEEWVDDKLRYRLIRALIETTREFRRVNNAKVIVAIRRDLLAKVIRETRDAGFQEEKYESLYVPLNWTKDNLIEIMDKRVALLVKRRYEKSVGVTHKDIFPAKIRKQQLLEYLFRRLLPRPRDVILFVNKCLERAENKRRLTSATIQDAEGDYSKLRLRAIADEWHSDYPLLIQYASILRNRPHSFAIETVTEKEINDFTVSILKARSEIDTDPIASACAQMETEYKIAKRIFLALYQAGIVALKPDSYATAEWAENGRILSLAELDKSTKVVIHGAFWRVFGVEPPRGK